MLCSLKRFIKEGLKKSLLFEPHQEREKEKQVQGCNPGGGGGWPLGMRQEATGKLPRTRYVHLRISLIPLPAFPCSLVVFFFAYFLLRSLFPSPLAKRSGDCKLSLLSPLPPPGALALFSSSGEYFTVSFIRIGCRLPVNPRDLMAHRSSNRENCDRINERKGDFFFLFSRNAKFS